MDGVRGWTGAVVPKPGRARLYGVRVETSLRNASFW